MPEEKTVAMGLTTPGFTDHEPDASDTASYKLLAVGSNGASAASEAIKVTSPEPKRLNH